MDEAHHQQTAPAQAVQGTQTAPGRQEHIGHQHHDGGEELEEGTMDTLHILDELVEHDDRGVQRRRTETEEDARQVAAGAAEVADAGDEHQAQGGHDKADDLLLRQTFPEEDGAKHGDDDGGEIITQGRHGNGGQFVGLEQEDPVEAHGHAGQEQQGDLLFDGRQGDLLLGDQQEHGDEGRRHDGPVQRQLAGGHADAPDKGGQGSENCHGRHEHPAGIG